MPFVGLGLTAYSVSPLESTTCSCADALPENQGLLGQWGILSACISPYRLETSDLAVGHGIRHAVWYGGLCVIRTLWTSKLLIRPTFHFAMPNYFVHRPERATKRNAGSHKTRSNLAAKFRNRGAENIRSFFLPLPTWALVSSRWSFEECHLATKFEVSFV
jgi:hypothetical protein